MSTNQITNQQLNQAWLHLWQNNMFSQASVVIVGAGAIGNNVVLGLAGFGLKELTIIDGDFIELHNLNQLNQ